MAKSKNNRTTTNQKELLAVMIISLLLGLAGGYGIKTVQSEDVLTTESSTSHSHDDSMRYEVPAENAPLVELDVIEDAKSGYNIKLITTNFRFTPEKVNQENVPGEGHAHLYVDGKKIGRLYGNYFHYDENFEGSKTFRVELNANDHSVYYTAGEAVESEITVTHDGSDPNHDAKHDIDE